MRLNLFKFKKLLFILLITVTLCFLPEISVAQNPNLSNPTEMSTAQVIRCLVPGQANTEVSDESSMGDILDAMNYYQNKILIQTANLYPLEERLNSSEFERRIEELNEILKTSNRNLSEVKSRIDGIFGTIKGVFVDEGLVGKSREDLTSDDIGTGTIEQAIRIAEEKNEVYEVSYASNLQNFRDLKERETSLLDQKKNDEDELNKLQNVGTSVEVIKADIASSKQCIRYIEQAMRVKFDTMQDENKSLSSSENFRIGASAGFALLVLGIIGGFFWVIGKDEKTANQLFSSSDSGIQLMALFLIVIAIILFGIMGVLEGKELSALLGGLSGYILGRTSVKVDSQAKDSAGGDNDQNANQGPTPAGSPGVAEEGDSSSPID